jgi:alcohol dehydrogenase, propanol-preferring
MIAMELMSPGQPLVRVERETPKPGAGQVRICIDACGICRTDLHVIDSELPGGRLPIVPGHEIVGRVEAVGMGADPLWIGKRVGVGWLGHTCGDCSYCLSGQENLCDRPGFTGFTLDGGFATHMIADARYVFPLPEEGEAAKLAPLMCAGMIGWRSLNAAGEAKRLGLYGFGAAAHIIIQVALWQGREVYAFTRPGDVESQAFAQKMGACWTGASGDLPDKPLDAAIIFAPVGELVPAALKAVRKGGRVVCAGIHMSDIPAFPYAILWGERSVASVANLTRRDGKEFLSLVPEVRITTSPQLYPPEQANQAIADLRGGNVHGAAVLIMT